MTQKTALRQILGCGCAALAFGLLPMAAAHAGDAAAAPAQWSDAIKFSGLIDGGYSSSFQNPKSGKNFGRLYDDANNEGELNQVALTALRAIDPAATGYDVGFKIQGIYGSDARYARPTHEFASLATKDRNQIDLAEFNVTVHTPWATEGGIDFKAGRFTAPEGAETLDPSGNNFYSHSYIYNFGIPTEATGFLATAHATSLVDLYLGADTGVNTSVDHGLLHAGNGSAPAVTVGAGLNLLEGKLTVLALSHIGAEFATQAANTGALSVPKGTDLSSKYRELSDITTVWKVSDKLTLTNELNWVHDDAIASTGNRVNEANAYGIAQYASYAINDIFTPAVRAEWFRDGKGVFVSQSGNNNDLVRSEEGLAALSVNSVTSGKTTDYAALTLGVNIKPPVVLPGSATLLIRPEVRYDLAVDGAKPFLDGSRQKDSLTTVGIDGILQF